MLALRFLLAPVENTLTRCKLYYLCIGSLIGGIDNEYWTTVMC